MLIADKTYTKVTPASFVDYLKIENFPHAWDDPHEIQMDISNWDNMHMVLQHQNANLNLFRVLPDKDIALYKFRFVDDGIYFEIFKIDVADARKTWIKLVEHSGTSPIDTALFDFRFQTIERRF